MTDDFVMVLNGAEHPVCLGDFHRTADEGLEGWCWYPDEPEERAIVEFLVNGEVVRAARATRFLQNRRALGTGDGYCGFWFPIPSEIQRGDTRSVLEVRERRFQQVFGRVVFGSVDRAQEIRLDGVDDSLQAIGSAINSLAQVPDFGSQLKELGRTLLHLATRPHERGRTRIPGLTACLDRIATVPAVDLGWSPNPHVSIIVPPPAADIVGLAATLRDASHALAALGAEFILLDDGASPLTAFLPTRLRYLHLIRMVATERTGGSLNAAAAIARGSLLAFAHPGGPHPAGLSEAVIAAGHGSLDLDIPAAAIPAPKNSKTQLHRLRCIVRKEHFIAMGGFDPGLEEAAMWLDIVDKANALRLQVRAWAPPVDPRLMRSPVTDHA